MRTRHALWTLFACLSALFLSACGGGGGSGRISQLAILEFVGVTLTPAFNPRTQFYNGAVAGTVSQVTLTANASQSNAAIGVNGTILGTGSIVQVLPLAQGDNVFEVTAAAADGSSIARYTVTITRAAEPALDGLSVSVGELSPAFAAATTSYAVATSFLHSSVIVTASTAVPGATIEVNGAAMASGQPSAPIALVEGRNTIVVRVETPAGDLRSYTVTLTRASLQQFLEQDVLPGPPNAEGFGVSVALDDDTLAVGAWYEDGPTQPDAGAVHVFTRSGATWTQQARLTASTPVAGGSLGFSVALEGDTLVAGELVASQVHVFTRTGITWTERAVLSPTGVATERFGNAVAISGRTIAVGCQLEDVIDNGNSLVDAGTVYMFEGSGATWTQLARLTASNVVAGAHFGAAVALGGDTLFVGAPEGVDGSAVDIYERIGSHWTHHARVRPLDTSRVSLFGHSLSFDSNRDRCAIGAPFNSVSGRHSGQVYVFARSGGVWNEEAVFEADNNESGNLFGVSVALEGDTLVVGARGESSDTVGVNPPHNRNAPESGAAYVFFRDASGWSERVFLKASDTSAFKRFGASLALDGGTIAVGAYAGSRVDVGKCYMFR